MTGIVNMFIAEGKEPLERETIANVKGERNHMMYEILENGGQGSLVLAKRSLQNEEKKQKS